MSDTSFRAKITERRGDPCNYLDNLRNCLLRTPEILFNGTRTHEVCGGSAMLNPMSYEATQFVGGQFVGLVSYYKRTRGMK